ncbi:MAG: ADP-ribosylglycohydrolase family protein, partial [Gemmatimonadota bacterium]
HPVGRLGARMQALAVREALVRGEAERAIEGAEFAGAVGAVQRSGASGRSTPPPDANGTAGPAPTGEMPASSSPSSMTVRGGGRTSPLGTGSSGRPEEASRAAAAREFDAALHWIATHLDADPAAAAATLGTGGRASRSVPAALWAFLSRPHDAEAAVVRAVGLGGDTDTIGAMTGALAGAYHGARAFPARWLDALEAGEHGRAYAERLAERLLEVAAHTRLD